MQKWLSGIRGAVVMSLTWAVGWGLGVGGLMELFVDPSGQIEDMWPNVLAIHGLLGGAVFWAALRIAEGRRNLTEVSLPRLGVWGAVTGPLVGVFAIALGAASDVPGAARVVGAMTLVSVLAAIGSSLLFRYAGRNDRSLSQLGSWAVVTGLLLGIFAVAMGAASEVLARLWLRATLLIGAITLLTVICALGSALLLRYVAEKRVAVRVA